MPPAVYDHVRPADGAYPPGVYRVVGVDDGRVTLLRVADADGRRAATGEVIVVDSLDGFEPAPNPDAAGSRPVGDVVASVVEATYWSLRVLLGRLAARPVAAAPGVALVALGLLPDGVVPLPDLAVAGLVAAGSLHLALVGAGRLG